MSREKFANTIMYSELESKLSELIATHQRFQEITGQPETTHGLMNDILRKAEQTQYIYSTYTTIIRYLESGCVIAGINSGQTLFSIYGDDLINEKANRKFSLGVFIIKLPTYHLAIPVKFPVGARYVFNDKTVYIYKPIIVQSKFDGRKKISIDEIDGFTNRYGKETARLMNIEISEDVDELSKSQIKKLKTAITTAMNIAELADAAAASSANPTLHVGTTAN
jgi:hypothetical protein